MNGFSEAAAARLERGLCGHGLPEMRKVEFYSNSMQTRLYDPDLSGLDAPWGIPELMDALSAFLLLDAQLEADQPEFCGLSLRERFKAFRPADRADRIVAQTYRLLKVLRGSISARDVHFRHAERDFEVTYIARPDKFSLHITYAGLELLAGLVAAYLGMRRLPHPRAYVEALLAQFYEDAAGEIRYFSDEDGGMVPLRKPFAFNRHMRLQCCDARFAFSGERLELEIPERFRNAALTPVDFFLPIEGVFHIIPMEALTGCGISREELPRWRARRPDPGEGLPAYDLRVEFEAADAYDPTT